MYFLGLNSLYGIFPGLITILVIKFNLKSSISLANMVILTGALYLKVNYE